MHNLMHKLKIISLASLSLFLVILLIVFFQRPSSLVENIPEVEHASEPVPDFSAYTDVTEKKQAFFDYLRPAVESQNKYLLRVRQFVQAMQAKLNHGEALSESQQADLDWLLEEYRVDKDQGMAEIFTALLRRIDVIPLELVLVQAANESGWGTSRFATEGYNFFGMWCYAEGCGFVPKRRNVGAVHEVAKYDDLSDAMYSYVRNLNRHPAYAKLRAIRAQLRSSQQDISAIKLSEGLEDYSERGEEYIQELQHMIITNRELI